MWVHIIIITEEKSKLDEDIQLFADELKRYFSEVGIGEIARVTGFVKEKVKLKVKLKHSVMFKSI